MIVKLQVVDQVFVVSSMRILLKSKIIKIRFLLKATSTFPCQINLIQLLSEILEV